jgi:hypothetical protein
MELSPAGQENHYFNGGLKTTESNTLDFVYSIHDSRIIGFLDNIGRSKFGAVQHGHSNITSFREPSRCQMLRHFKLLISQAQEWAPLIKGCPWNASSSRRYIRTNPSVFAFRSFFAATSPPLAPRFYFGGPVISGKENCEIFFKGQDKADHKSTDLQAKFIDTQIPDF